MSLLRHMPREGAGGPSRAGGGWAPQRINLQAFEPAGSPGLTELGGINQGAPGSTRKQGEPGGSQWPGGESPTLGEIPGQQKLI